MKDKNPKNACEKYGIAITNYVLGEDLRMPKEELLAHLKQCAKCHAELLDWQNTYAAMRTKSYHDKPEVKVKWAKFIQELVNSPVQCESMLPPGAKDVNIDDEYGLPAGHIWHLLGKEGPTRIDEIPKKTNHHPETAKYATGWLMGQNKVCMKEFQNARYIYLNKDEQVKF
ncbi:MAG: winged helix-turn-helix domain-containing protein, partial [Planctomycetes bacterium]|nr:winged helix-turn-helix domain-containing protein [Planctomycetota bacterium]